MVERVGKFFGVSKNSNPIKSTPPSGPKYFQKPHLKILLPWGYISIYKLGKDISIQSKAEIVDFITLISYSFFSIVTFFI